MILELTLGCLASLPATIPAQEQDSRQPWIFSQQASDGSWSAQGQGALDERFRAGEATDDVVVTSLLVLACYGDGQTAEHGPQSTQVAAALDWLVARQAEDGCLADRTSSTALADHALATLALSEATFLGSGARCREAAHQAVRFLESKTLAEGGWSASGLSESEFDLRTSAWASQAMASALDAELTNRGDIIAAAAWRARRAGMTQSALPRDASFELLTRSIAGEKFQDSAEFANKVTKLLEPDITWNATGQGFDPEFVYVRTLLAYRAGGETWRSWSKSLGALQKDMGPDERNRLVVDPGVPGGSLAATGFSILTLEVYFRYARIIGAR